VPEVVIFIRLDQTKKVLLVKTEISVIVHLTVTKVVVLVRLARTKLDATNVLVRQPEKGVGALLIQTAPLSKQAIHLYLRNCTGFEISVV
jgi:hypothetical protein